MKRTLMLAAGAAILTLAAAPAEAGTYAYCQTYARNAANAWAPPPPATAFAGGAAGAIGGAVIGGLVDGHKGAQAGALIGGGISAVAGASKGERKYRKVYDQAFHDCMARNHPYR